MTMLVEDQYYTAHELSEQFPLDVAYPDATWREQLRRWRDLRLVKPGVDYKRLRQPKGQHPFVYRCGAIVYVLYTYPLPFCENVRIAHWDILEAMFQSLKSLP